MAKNNNKKGKDASEDVKKNQKPSISDVKEAHKSVISFPPDSTEENIEVVLLGEIERNSLLYAIAQKYIRNLKWGERKGDVDYSYQLQTLPKHFYFTLFSNYLG